MATHTPTSDQEGVIPLFALAPKDGDPFSAFPDVVNVSGSRAPVLRRTEFGYDIRLEGAGTGHAAPAPFTYAPSRPWRKFAVVGLILAVLGGIVFAMLSQDGVRARLFGGTDPAPSAAPVATAPTPTADVPSPTAVPSATPAPATPTPAPATPKPAPSAPPAVPPASNPVTLTFHGTFTAAPGGQTTTACDSAQTGRGQCSWTVSLQPGNELFLGVDWQGGATLSLKVLAQDGSTINAQSSANGHLDFHLATPPSSVRVIVGVANGSTASFTLTVANHAS
jgi:hypothetical protein